MGDPADPDKVDPSTEVRRPPVPGPYPGSLDERLLTPRAPLAPGAGIRVVPSGIDPFPSTSHPPAWARDPTGRHQWRWWGGVAWTDHVADHGVTAEDPLDQG